MTGMIFSVYKSGRGDSTNGGVSSYVESLTVVGDDVPEIFDEAYDRPTVKLVIRNVCGTSFPIIVPADSTEAGGTERYMFGGNFAWTSDSRVSRWLEERGFTNAPVKIFDRQE